MLANTYPCRVMIETLLSYGGDTKNRRLASALLYPDLSDHMDVIDFAENAGNGGLYKRSRFTHTSRVVGMMGRIHADMFFQDR